MVSAVFWHARVLLLCVLVLAVQAVLQPLPQAWGAVLAGLALLVAASLGWTLRVRVSRPLSAVSSAAQRLAAGDLSGSFAGAEQGPTAALWQALARINERVFAVVAGVRSGTGSIAATAGIMISDNGALATRTDAQAASLEDTASSMQEMAATVRQNAENARQASDVVTATRAAAGRGRDVVQQVVRNMTALKEGSAQVAEIVALIDGIAFQTNILALNAAVEAARAGEQGRGFAVVAGEVRMLAQRAASAASDVKRLITASVQQVDAGGVLVADAGRAMEEIVDSVDHVGRLMADIAAASSEQSAGIEEINRSVADLEAMTQENGTLVQDLRRTADGLREEAEQLTGVASAFRLGTREFGTAEEAVGMVRAAVEFVRTHGADALVGEVRKLSGGRFVDRDLYLSVYHVGGQVAAHGASRRFWGLDWKPFKDAGGRPFVADIVKAAVSAGSGWTEYLWVHPQSQKTLTKSVYFERCGDLVIACGTFKQDQKAAPVVQVQVPARTPKPRPPARRLAA